jgi:multiple sugar transport system substrate-binding protein
MRRFLPSILFLLAAAGGCARNSPTDESRPKPKAPPSPIRLLVVDDSALAKSVGRLKTEWQARTGGALEIKEVPAVELLTAELLGGDAVIYPSHQLGTLAERDLIVPVPEEILKSPALDWPDVLELIQVAESTWGQRVFAIPFGSPLLTCYYRADLLERAGREPPKTWTEYQELVEYFSQRENLGDAVAHDAPWFGTVEPLGPGWAGRVLLARAAAYAKHRDNYSTLFRIDSMEPLIDTPPFVRALEELVAAARHSPPDSISFDPSAARRHFKMAKRRSWAELFPWTESSLWT